MLNNAVYNISQLLHIQDLAYQLHISSGRAQTYDEYCSFLVLAAISYDNVHKTAASFNRNNNKRRIYQHDVDYNHDYSSSEDEERSFFDVNTHISEIQEYKASSHKPRPPIDTSGNLPMSIYEDMDDKSRSS